MPLDSRIPDQYGYRHKPHKAVALVESGYAVWNEDHTAIHRLSELRDLEELRTLRSDEAKRNRKVEASLAAAEVGGVIVRGIEQNLVLAFRARLFARGEAAY